MLKDYLPLLIMFITVVGVVAAILVASTLLSNRRRTKGKADTYECGMTPVGDARRPFSPRFYVTAVLFILFDIESVFLIPWALNLGTLGGSMALLLFVEMFIFLAILGLGLVYVWRKGGLDWKR
jgi:NADH-quinone oxidoreductase subunit A